MLRTVLFVSYAKQTEYSIEPKHIQRYLEKGLKGCNYDSDISINTKNGPQYVFGGYFVDHTLVAEYVYEENLMRISAIPGKDLEETIFGKPENTNLQPFYDYISQLTERYWIWEKSSETPAAYICVRRYKEMEEEVSRMVSILKTMPGIKSVKCEVTEHIEPPMVNMEQEPPRGNRDTWEVFETKALVTVNLYIEQ